ncbi:glycosyltransferase family 2 protein [Candidatus Saccharibacteria bacterium]|nr:glycosyltransferase family 2 protein [Candidatus Saccharibacteria bacterium]
MPKTLTLSIIIPVYNEEQTLQGCLDSILTQTVQPNEVIVVDNNSTDNTLAIAKKFNNIKIVHEEQQGVLHARTTGFNLATSDILGRIDADTRLEPNWVEQLLSIMKDKTIAGVTGSSHWYDMPFSPVNHKIEHFFKNILFKHQKNFPFLFGTNMAIRRSAWININKQLCVKDYIFEDADIAIHLYQQKKKIVYDSRLRVGMSARRYANGFNDFVRYIRLQSITYKQHDIHSLGSSIAIVMYMLGYLLLRPLLLSYDQKTGKRSFKKLFTNPDKPRPLPFD